MKKSILAIFFLPIALNLTAQPDYNNVFKLTLTDLILSTVTLKYERVLHDRLSFEISGSYSYKKITIWDDLRGNFTGPSAGVQMRYYFPPLSSVYSGSDASEGLYAALWSKWDKYAMNISIGNNKVNLLDGQSLSGGFNMGCQFWLMNTLFLDIYAGGGFMSSTYTGKFAPKGKLLSFNSSGFVPKLGISIGYPF